MPVPTAGPDLPAMPADAAEPPVSPRRQLLEHAALAVFAALASGAVMAWAGAVPVVYLLGGVGIAVVVLAANRLTNSPQIPPPPGSRDRRRGEAP